MTIQEALEKAKQLSRERAVFATEPVARTAGLALRRRESDGHAAVAPSMPLRKLHAERLSYERRRCIANRVLIPEASGGFDNNAAAAYRILRARVLQRLRARQWTSVGVTSPGPGDGKTVTALNVAIAIAREKNSDVFLLDLDMRNPSLCQTLGVEPREELVRYFNGEARAEDVFFSVGIEHLTLAGSLASSEQSSELLANGRLAELLDFIGSASANPLVIVDLPPTLSTDDVLVAGPQVDALLVVVNEGKTRRDGLARTLEVLGEFTVAGIVLNRSSEAVTDYYGSRSAP
jgi:Mrp family chromosome partitioning ATPase